VSSLTYTNAGSTGTGSPARAWRAAAAIGATLGEGSASRVATARVKGGLLSQCSSTSPGARTGSSTMVSRPPRGVATAWHAGSHRRKPVHAGVRLRRDN